MKFLSLVLGIVLASALQVSAQMSVEVSLDQEQFLVGEPIMASVKIKNRSGQTLRLGEDVNWLTISVESREGFVVIKTGEVPVLGAFNLDTSMTATKRVDIAPYFTFPRHGRYSIIATVNVKGWGNPINSQPASFDVIEGATLWAQEFGVPNSAPPDQRPEVRKYSLEQANYLRSQLRLYLRVTDASSGKAFKVYPIGSMVSFGQPEAQMDKLCNLHVLYQNGSRSFSYHVFNPNGDVMTRHIYSYTSTRPRLSSGAEGAITIVGGKRVPSASDLPKQVTDAGKPGAKP